MIVYENGLDDW